MNSKESSFQIMFSSLDINISRSVGIVVSFLGFLVMLAWFTDIQILLTLLPALASMKFNTALCFLFLGAYLLIIEVKWIKASLVTYFLPLSVLIISSLTLFAYYSQTTLILDEIIVKDPYTPISAFPGRMSIGTAFTFTLIAIGSLLYKHRSRIAEFLAIVAHLIALTAVLGYFYDTRALYKTTFFSTMAVHTALAFMVLSIGLIFIIPNGIVRNLVIRRDPSGTAARYLLPAALIIPVFCDWLVWEGYVAGLYDSAFTSILMTMLTIIIMALFALGFAVVAHRWYTHDEQVQQQVMAIKLEKERELITLKERFLAMISHDLRNPLTAIILSSDLLRSYNNRMTSEKRLRHLDKIQYQAQNMVGLLEDIMLLSSSETDGLPFQPTESDLVTFCNEHFQKFAELENDKPHQFIANIAAPSIKMSFDEHLLTRMLNNILRNAVKYSPDGGTISLSVTRNDDHALLTISDTGIGIPEEHLSKLFHLFSRANNVGNLPGYGLGLAIVKQIIELHQGTIEVESTEGEGTSFTFILPIAPKTNDMPASA